MYEVRGSIPLISTIAEGVKRNASPLLRMTPTRKAGSLRMRSILRQPPFSQSEILGVMRGSA